MGGGVGGGGRLCKRVLMAGGRVSVVGGIMVTIAGL